MQEKSRVTHDALLRGFDLWKQTHSTSTGIAAINEAVLITDFETNNENFCRKESVNKLAG